ncbi:MAG: BLUF domain-containing protein [Staphylococcus equorum]|nr:BLUF domain-containing protein [Lactococcus lactis]MDN5638814.1 BLUF domain-containing protein [Staphylococcus equorum]
MENVRLLYVSKIAKIDTDLKKNLINILDEAVDFNYRNNVMGVLYYGHGYFLQCIEGEKSTIDDLFFNKIANDKRHINCEILYYIECDERLFSAWNMKFLPINKKIIQFFKHYDLEDLNPYLLTAETAVELVSILAGEPESNVRDYAA